jgi:GntR family transcriptional regulator/MocR family aminotransferase
MVNVPSFPILGTITLDRASGLALYRQLYDNLREAILSGRLVTGTQLPATRTLADELDVSRNTVITAYEQLMAEGYLEGKIGAGTYVTRDLPDELLQVRAEQAQTLPPAGTRQAPSDLLSRRGAVIARTAVTHARHQEGPRPFRTGLPALDELPFKVWGRLLARRWRTLSPAALGYGPEAGYQPLREAIAAYLGAARGVRCRADQVIILAGAQQAIDLTARLLLNPGDAVWLEDPGYLGARGALLAAGARLVPVPVDDQGLNVEAGLRQDAEARLVYVSPSHQYPLGVTMSLARRLALLQWAAQADAWILEDDYDSEYRYAGRPLAALQGLDSNGRVIYIGTFSKVLFPGLRLGYMVVPPDLIDAFSRARTLIDRGSAWLDQAVLTDFIVEGHFARHIRRMRALYAERQTLLVDLLRRKCAGRLEIRSAEAGLHVVGWLSPGIDDRPVSEQLSAQGIEALPISSYALTPQPRGGLILGYAAVNAAAIRKGVRRLEKTLAAVDSISLELSKTKARSFNEL